ncbi:chitin deacetylase [Mortierella hygrophila]|uniref:Chitin deacetylase n=1 Tax=Mortierella hygrophila TaxID=979708 RepID=A0A9P6F7R8_9FUNG|nr:chitin deacetylase [Mortierella hygrophila]
MYLKLSVIAALVAVATAAPSTTTAAAAAPSAIAAPIIPLPPFSGTLVGAYPTQDKIAPTDTPLVKQWLAELNLTSVATWPVVPFTAGGDPQNPNAIPAAACDWTETNCINKDITTCPLGVWGLTYDDGPTEFSGKLYDFLDTTDQKATLFYIGSNVVENPALARRACGAGHQIAVHTWSHNPSTSLTNEQFIAEIKYTEMAIKELCGFTPRYFRPPYGDIDDRIRGLLWAMGYTSVIWDYDTNDWMMAPGGTRTMAQVDAAFAQWIAAAPTDKTGHVTLEHELYANTVDAAIANLPKIQATWKAMPVSACVNDAHPYTEKNITLATMNGAKAGVTTGNTTASVTVSAGGTTATGSAGSSKASGSADHSTSAGAVISSSATVLAAAAAVALGQMLF